MNIDRSFVFIGNSSSTWPPRGQQRIHGDSRTVTDVKCARRHPGTRTNVRVLLVYSRDCYRDANAKFRGPPHNESTLRRVSAGVLLSLSPLFSSRGRNFFFRFQHLSRIALSRDILLRFFFLSFPVAFSLVVRARAALNEMSQVSYRLPS